MAYIVSVDFDYSEPLQMALRRIEKHDGAIVLFAAEGPAGGNPNVALSFDQRGDALDFLKEHFQTGESVEFLNGLIAEVE